MLVAWIALLAAQSSLPVKEPAWLMQVSPLPLLCFSCPEAVSSHDEAWLQEEMETESPAA